MIYNFTLTAGGGGERERDAEKGEKYISSVFSLCQQIPEWFPGFDYFSFYDCNNTEGARERDESDEEHLVFSWVEELEAMVLCRCRVCMSPQNHYGTPRRPAIELASTNGDQLYINSYFEGKLKLMVLAHSHEG